MESNQSANQGQLIREMQMLKVCLVIRQHCKFTGDPDDQVHPEQLLDIMKDNAVNPNEKQVARALCVVFGTREFAKKRQNSSDSYQKIRILTEKEQDFSFEMADENFRQKCYLTSRPKALRVQRRGQPPSQIRPAKMTRQPRSTDENKTMSRWKRPTRTRAERRAANAQIQKLESLIEKLCEIPVDEFEREFAEVVISELTLELKFEMQKETPGTPLESIELKQGHITIAVRKFLKLDKLRPSQRGCTSERETVVPIYRGLRFKDRPIKMPDLTGGVPVFSLRWSDMVSTRTLIAKLEERPENRGLCVLRPPKDYTKMLDVHFRNFQARKLPKYLPDSRLVYQQAFYPQEHCHLLSCSQPEITLQTYLEKPAERLQPNENPLKTPRENSRYASGIPTIFGTHPMPLNLNCLPSEFSDILQGYQISCLMPMCHAGQAGTVFPLQIEPEAAISLVYLWEGAEKCWIVFDPKDYDKIISALAELLPHKFKRCEEDPDACPRYHLHGRIVIDPDVLAERAQVQYSVYHQRKGEFVVIAARAFHTGYNLGQNWCEAAKVGSKRWFQLNLNHLNEHHCENECPRSKRPDRIDWTKERRRRPSFSEGEEKCEAPRALMPASFEYEHQTSTESENEISEHDEYSEYEELGSTHAVSVFPCSFKSYA